MSQLSAIYLDGSLNLTVRDVSNSFEDINNVVEFLTATRPTDASALEMNTAYIPEHYITLRGDVNSFIDVSYNGGDGTDDAWILKDISATDVTINKNITEITLSDADGTNSVDFSFSITCTVPDDADADVVDGSAITVGQVSYTLSGDLGTPYYTISGGSQFGTTLTYKLTPGFDASGKLTFTHEAYTENGAITNVSISEVTSYQQILNASIWTGIDEVTAIGTNNRTTPGDPATGADILSVDISDNTGLLATQLLNAGGDLNDASGETIIQGMTLTVHGIAADISSNLSKWAHAQGRDGSGNTLLFQEDQEIWIKVGSGNTDFTETVTLRMNDYDGVKQDVLSMDFGVKLVQDASGAHSGTNFNDPDQDGSGNNLD